MMEEISELIRQYGFEEDSEHIIIPLPEKDGLRRRCFLLKRRFIRLVFPERQFVDYPLERVVQAITDYPDLPLSEALHILYREKGEEIPEIYDDEEEDTHKRDIS